MEKHIIEAEMLSKSYGKVNAVCGINIKVKKGEIFAILGPNGAGKTTTISMLCGILLPSSGKATVAGFDIVKERIGVRKSIGVVFQQPSVDDLLTGRENLRMHALLYGLPREKIEERISEMLSIVGLDDRADALVREYSGGMRRRLEIARGLLHNPAVLFLDEPTAGLDPQSRQYIWEYIKNVVKKEGRTVIFTTHYLEEAEMFADRIALIDYGKIIAVGTPKELVGLVGGDEVTFTSKNPHALAKALKRNKGVVKSIEFDGKNIRAVITNSKKSLPLLLKRLPDVESIEIKFATLNDFFIKKTGRRLREDTAEGSFWERIMDDGAKR